MAISTATSWWEEAQKKREAHQKAIKAEVEQIIDRNPNGKELLDKRFLRNFGCINFISDEARHELELAREYHRLMKATYPEGHDEHEEEPMRCYHVTKCKCGFQEACDSSD